MGECHPGNAYVLPKRSLKPINGNSPSGLLVLSDVTLDKVTVKVELTSTTTMSYTSQALQVLLRPVSFHHLSDPTRTGRKYRASFLLKTAAG